MPQTQQQQQKMYDLHSDTVTEPTSEMFDLMRAASVGDDVFAVSQKIDRNLITNHVTTIHLFIGRYFDQ
jgi:threonine aldolase